MQCALIKFVREVTGNEKGIVQEFMNLCRVIRQLE